MNRAFRRRLVGVLGVAWVACVAWPVHAQMGLDDIGMLPPVLAKGGQGHGLSAFTGLTVIDGDPYWRVDLRPTLNFGRLGIGLKGVLLIGQPSGNGAEEGKTKILTEDGEEWNSAGSLLRAIRYVRWAMPRAPLYIVYGELFDAQIGHGLLMSGYTNFDRRGVRLNVNRDGWGFESLLNDVNNPELFGGRLFVRPLALANVGGLMKRLTVGATVLADVNPFPDEPAKKTLGIRDEDPLLAYAADVAFPILSADTLLLELYDEWAILSFPSPNPGADVTQKTGNAVGIGLEYSTLRAKLEYRTFEEGFLPTLFGSDYELLARTPGRSLLPDPPSKATTGVYGSASLNLNDQAAVAAIFEDYNGAGPSGEPRLAVRFSETALIEQIDVQAYYSKRGIGGTKDGEKQSFFKDLVDLDEKSLFVVEVDYKVTGPLQVRLIREYRFRKRADGEGFEPIKKTTVQLGLAMSF